MAKNSIEAYGAEGKSNVLFFDPEKLTLVTDETSALYCPLVHLPVSEPMVLNIMALGVRTPISVAKNPETGAVEVVAGWQRVKAAREANRRLVARGEEPIQIPGIARRDKADVLQAEMVSENEVRSADTPIGRAEKMARMQARGRSDDYIATIFGCGVATVRSTMALLEAPAAVRDAVEAGTINIGHAKAIAKLAPEVQREKVAELVQAGEGATGHEKARKQRAVVETVSTPKPKMRSRAEVEARMALQQPGSAGHSALAWVLGGEDA